jgi:hypothetical protein
MAPPSTVLYFRVLHSHFSTNFFKHINPFWFCKTKHFHIPQAQNYSIQNGVNIQDGDFTFIHPYV